jgi:hypothetical protein
MLGSLNHVTHELIVHISPTKRSSDFVAHLEKINARFGPRAVTMMLTHWLGRKFQPAAHGVWGLQLGRGALPADRGGTAKPGQLRSMSAHRPATMTHLQ